MVSPDKADLLIVDDDPLILRTIQHLIKRYPFRTFIAQSHQNAKNILDQEPIDIMILDLVLPDQPGMDLISLAKRKNNQSEVIVLTGHSSIASAIEATKLGAFAYLPKPLEKESFYVTLRNALESSKLKTENRLLKDSLKREYHFANIVGASSEIQKIFRTIEKISDTDSTILITGESGTGKELIAKAIHYNSARAKHPFIAINCSAIPEDLLESELFGHVKGAFTGAISNRPGRFLAAHKGSLFLDEIGDTPLNIQTKLLRIIQEKTFEPVGSNQKIEVDVRIISATNQNLPQLIQKRLFREDLYYRLNVIPIDVPPLRNRKEDIPLLVRHFIHRFCIRNKRSLVEIENGVIGRLTQYHWPGNIRELENLIEHLVVFTEGNIILSQDLPKHVFSPPELSQNKDLATIPLSPPLSSTNPSWDLKKMILQLEQSWITEALRMTGGNKNQAAKLLNIKRTTLIEKMKKRKMTAPEL